MTNSKDVQGHGYDLKCEPSETIENTETSEPSEICGTREPNET